MCLLFVYVNPHPSPDSYTVIIANVRDELFNRATKPASPWLPDHPHCVGGVDIERPGYGTWLATSDTGKIACLLNILSPDMHCKPMTRGRLVSNYVSSSTDALTYLKTVQSDLEDKCEYNPFRLVLIEHGLGEDWTMCSLSSGGEAGVKVHSPGIHAFCNSTFSDKPWQKAVHGREIFESIVRDHSAIDQERNLVSSLFALLMDRKHNFPDSVLEEQGAHLRQMYPGRLEELGHIFVQARDPDYGSRTHTVILVDYAGSCQYIEKTMKEPIDADNPEWEFSTVHQEMTLGHTACHFSHL